MGQQCTCPAREPTHELGANHRSNRDDYILSSSSGLVCCRGHACYYRNSAAIDNDDRSRDFERSDSRAEQWEEVGEDDRAIDVHVVGATPRPEVCTSVDLGHSEKDLGHTEPTMVTSAGLETQELALEVLPALEQSVRGRMASGRKEGNGVCPRLSGDQPGCSGGVSRRLPGTSEAPGATGPRGSAESLPPVDFQQTKVSSECSRDRLNNVPPLLDKTHPNYQSIGKSADEPGGIYQGQVKRLGKDAMYHGYGYLSSRHTTMLGQFNNGKPHGQVTQTWPDGRLYRGQYANGLFNGQGLMEWQTPRGNMVYDGQYKADKKHGQGTFYWPSGKKYEGQWQAGQRHGEGMDTNWRGQRCRGMWRENVLEGWLDGEPGEDHSEGSFSGTSPQNTLAKPLTQNSPVKAQKPSLETP